MHSHWKVRLGQTGSEGTTTAYGLGRGETQSSWRRARPGSCWSCLLHSKLDRSRKVRLLSQQSGRCDHIRSVGENDQAIAGCTFPVLSPRGCLPDHSVAVASSISLFRSGGKHDQRKPHRTFSGKNCGSHFPCECVLVAPSVSTQFVKAGTTDENPVAPSVCVYSGCGVLSFPFRVAASTSRRRRSHGKRASEDYSSRKSR